MINSKNSGVFSCMSSMDKHTTVTCVCILLHVKLYFSRTQRKATRWYSVIRVTSACTRHAMESQQYRQAPGCVVPVPSACVLNVCCVRTRGVPWSVHVQDRNGRMYPVLSGFLKWALAVWNAWSPSLKYPASQ